jgi:hypothetical protein
MPAQRARSAPPPLSLTRFLGGIGGLAVIAGAIALIAALHPEADGGDIPGDPRPRVIRPVPPDETLRSPGRWCKGRTGMRCRAGRRTSPERLARRT